MNYKIIEELRVESGCYRDTSAFWKEDELSNILFLQWNTSKPMLDTQTKQCVREDSNYQICFDFVQVPAIVSNGIVSSPVLTNLLLNGCCIKPPLHLLHFNLGTRNRIGLSFPTLLPKLEHKGIQLKETHYVVEGKTERKTNSG